MTHTPGPWKYFAYQDEVDGYYVVGDTDKIAEVLASNGKGHPDVACMWDEANARLIAAAPDLLASAQEALSILASGKDDWREEVLTDLRAAIEKATGGTS